MRIKVDYAQISYTDNSEKASARGYFDAGEDDVTDKLSGVWESIDDLLKAVNKYLGFSPFIQDYWYVKGAEDVIYTSELVNEDFDFVTDDEVYEYESGRLNLYEAVLAINIQIEKFDYPDSNDLKKLGLK